MCRWCLQHAPLVVATINDQPRTHVFDGLAARVIELKLHVRVSLLAVDGLHEGVPARHRLVVGGAAKERSAGVELQVVSATHVGGERREVLLAHVEVLVAGRGIVPRDVDTVRARNSTGHAEIGIGAQHLLQLLALWPFDPLRIVGLHEPRREVVEEDAEGVGADVGGLLCRVMQPPSG